MIPRIESEQYPVDRNSFCLSEYIEVRQQRPEEDKKKGAARARQPLITSECSCWQRLLLSLFEEVEQDIYG